MADDWLSGVLELIDASQMGNDMIAAHCWSRRHDFLIQCSQLKLDEVEIPVEYFQALDPSLFRYRPAGQNCESSFQHPLDCNRMRDLFLQLCTTCNAC